MKETVETTVTVTTTSRHTYNLDADERFEITKAYTSKRVLVDEVVVVDQWVNGRRHRDIRWTGNRLLKDGKIGSNEQSPSYGKIDDASVLTFAAKYCPVPDREPFDMDFTAVRDEIHTEWNTHALAHPDGSDQRFRDGLAHCWAKLARLGFATIPRSPS